MKFLIPIILSVLTLIIIIFATAQYSKPSKIKTICKKISIEIMSIIFFKAMTQKDREKFFK